MSIHRSTGNATFSGTITATGGTLTGTFNVSSYTVGSNGSQTVSAVANVFANSGSDALYLGVKNAAYPNRGWAFKTTTNGVNSDFTIREHGSTGDRLTIATGGATTILGNNSATPLTVN